MGRANFRIAARVGPVVRERLVEGALHAQLLEHGNPEHELIDELRLHKSRLLDAAYPLKFLVVLLILFLQVGNGIACGALGV